MQQKQHPKNRKGHNPLEDKLSSQIKRIEELLKSGDIPWKRVKSAFEMCELAIAQSSPQLNQLYPFRYYIKLSTTIFRQLFQYFDDVDEIDPTRKIQAKMLQQKRSVFGKILDRPPVCEDLAVDNPQIASNEKMDILRKVKVSSQNLVESELKKVIDSLDASKTSLIRDFLKGQSSNQHVSEELKQELNDIFGSWKVEVAEKYRQLNKLVEQSKLQHEEALRKKDQEIAKLKTEIQTVYCGNKSHSATQTINLQRLSETAFREKQLEYTIEKERFIRITLAHEKEITELKKYNKSLRTSNHLKLEEYEKNINQLTTKMKYVKNQFREYYDENKSIEGTFLDIFEKHQKAKTPFIPKTELTNVYQRLKKRARKESSILRILVEEDSELPQPSKRQLNQMPLLKVRRPASNINQPLLDVLDAPCNIHHFNSPTKPRNSIKASNSKHPSSVLNKTEAQDSLPPIKASESLLRLPPRNLSPPKSNSEIRQVQSLHIDSKAIQKHSHNFLSIPYKQSNNHSRQGSYTKISSKQEIHVENQRQNINSLYVSSNNGQRPSRDDQIADNFSPLAPQIGLSSDIEYKSMKASMKLVVSKTFIAERNSSEEENSAKPEVNEDQSVNYMVKIHTIEEDLQMYKKRTSIDIKQSRPKMINVPSLDNSQTLPVNRSILEPSKVLRIGQENRSMYNKQNRKEQRKENVMNNFEKQVGIFMEKYRQRLQNGEVDPEMDEEVEKVKKTHSLACTKTVCHHLRKFYDKLRKMRYEEPSKKPLKVAQLDIKHER